MDLLPAPTSKKANRRRPRLLLSLEALEDRLLLDGGLAKTDTQLLVAPNPTVYGQPVTLTAIVAPTHGNTMPTGTVTFRDANQVLGRATLGVVNGHDQATLAVSSLGVGNHPIQAVYSGDGQDQSSLSNAQPQEVDQAATTTTVSGAPPHPHVGDLVTFTAIVSAVVPGAGVPTGSVKFFDGTSLLGTGTLHIVQGADEATFATNQLGVGNHNITAQYLGDDSFSGSQDQILFDPFYDTDITYTVSEWPIVVGVRVTITATVTATGGPPPSTGWVSFDFLNVNRSVTPSSGIASISGTFANPGTIAFHVAYLDSEEDNQYDLSYANSYLTVVAPPTPSIPPQCFD